MRASDTMGGLAKGLRVIEAFSGETSKMTIAEVARATGLERATARRCLMTLTQSGHAEFDGKFYRLTPRVLRLGIAYLAASPLPTLLQPVLEDLAQATGESCSATVLDGQEIVYIARASQKRVMSIGLTVGSRLPAYCSSMGRVLLAALEPEAARAIVQNSDRRARTAKTRTETADVMAEIDAVRMAGHALVDEELEIGLRSLAVPVLSRNGTVVAAMNIGAHSLQMSAETMLATVLPKLHHAQRELARIVL